MDINAGKMLTVEAASKGRWCIKEIGAEPFFHANMYINLHVDQVKRVSHSLEVGVGVGLGVISNVGGCAGRKPLSRVLSFLMACSAITKFVEQMRQVRAEFLEFRMFFE